MTVLSEIKDATIAGNMEKTVAAIEQAVSEGMPPGDIIQNGLIEAMTVVGEKFKIKGTPTMVIINREAKKGKKLTGNKEITKDNALKAIETLKSL